MQKKKLTIQETFTLAYQYHNKNNFRDSEKLYKEVLKKQPEQSGQNSENPPEVRSWEVSLLKHAFMLRSIIYHRFHNYF